MLTELFCGAIALTTVTLITILMFLPKNLKNIIFSEEDMKYLIRRFSSDIFIPIWFTRTKFEEKFKIPYGKITDDEWQQVINISTKQLNTHFYKIIEEVLISTEQPDYFEQCEQDDEEDFELRKRINSKINNNDINVIKDLVDKTVSGC